MSSNQEDKDFKAQYKKYKYKLKMWEVSFKKKHNRIPSKVEQLSNTYPFSVNKMVFLV